MGRKAVKKIEIREIADFLKKLNERFKIEKVILFGSRARGEHLKQSDYDFIVISHDFKKVPFLRRLEMLYELWDNDLHSDILAYTPDEFEHKSKQIGIVQQAAKEGVVIR